MILSSRKIGPTGDEGYTSPTSVDLAKTERILTEYIPMSCAAVPATIEKRSHLQYLIRNLNQGFPVRYISQDASQPWLLFWTLQSFCTLQIGLDPMNRHRAVEKIMSWQHPDGGFGGGPGQAPHLLPNYAAVVTLAIVGSPGPKGGWDQVDREKMYKFFMSLKQEDGSFQVSKHSEVDVRGIYCLLVAATLLDILTPELVEGTAEFIASCQTYEGGFGSSSQKETSTTFMGTRPSLGEAHGGYTYCALASWVLLQPFIKNMSKEKPSINIPNLHRWLTQMQGAEIEIGGFKGRTNKLVDGCYAWWCGASFLLLEALGVHARPEVPPEPEPENPNDLWADFHALDNIDALYDRGILQQYVLYAGQYPTGGWRDKPPKQADAYHSLYCLSGLSVAQHHVTPSPAREAEILAHWRPDTKPGVDEELRKKIFVNMMNWTEDEEIVCIAGVQNNNVNATHPITNLTITHTESMMVYFYGQNLSPRPLPPPPRWY